MDRHNELQPGLTSTEELNEKIADASKTIFSYCMGKTQNRAEAEDLCQDILCELVRSVINLRDNQAFYGFMWAVAGNVYKQWCRKRARVSTCELTEELAEEGNALSNHLFNFCQMESRWKDRICFTDYLPGPKGSHHDFYGNDHYINLVCDIAHGRWEHFSEYDLEAVAELIRKGYVLKEKDAYTATIPLFTAAQSDATTRLVGNFVSDRLSGILSELTLLSTKILGEHTPKYLRDQVPHISSRCMLVNAGYIPLKVLIDQKVLSTDWNPLEIPTAHIVLG